PGASRPRTRPWRCTGTWRSEEHTSELQSLTNLVCRLLLEKKKSSVGGDVTDMARSIPRQLQNRAAVEFDPVATHMCMDAIRSTPDPRCPSPYCPGVLASI